MILEMGRVGSFLSNSGSHYITNCHWRYAAAPARGRYRRRGHEFFAYTAWTLEYHPSIFHNRPNHHHTHPPPSSKRRAHILRPSALASLRPPRNTSQTLRSSFRHGQHPPQRRSKFPLHPRRAHRSARPTRVQRRVVSHIPSLGFDVPGSVGGRRR